jgi:hypothetical protein
LANPAPVKKIESEPSFIFEEKEETIPAGAILSGTAGRALPGTDLGFLQPDPVDEDPPWVRELAEGNAGELAAPPPHMPGA